MVTKKVIVLSGPTAVGKTKATLTLAKRLGTIVVNADSRQIYRGMNIGTAKPSAQERSEVPHYLYDYLDPQESISAGKWAAMAEDILYEHFKEREQLPILSGGSAFYFRALFEGFDDYPEVQAETQARLAKDYEQYGITALQKELSAKDPLYYASIDVHNPRRLMRALGVIRQTALPFSSFQKKEKATRVFEPIYIALVREREDLYARINHRVDEMIDRGLEQEARTLYPLRKMKSLQTIGYQEYFRYFDGEITLDEAVRLIKRNSRRYAKRQLTWFKNQQDWKLLPADKENEIQDYIRERIG